MKLTGPMLAVKEMDVSVMFYKEVLGLDVVLDFGANKTLTGGLVLQSEEMWKGFIASDNVQYGGNDFELYFETDDFDVVVEKLRGMDIQYVHPIKEHAWGQRVVRIYDPDRHIIEIGECLTDVCLRFLNSGMTPEQTAKRMDVPLDFVNSCRIKN